MDRGLSCGANSSSVTQEMYSILRNPKVHWRVQISLIVVHARSRPHPPNPIFKFHFDTIPI
jgi:hypothetical protein